MQIVYAFLLSPEALGEMCDSFDKNLSFSSIKIFVIVLVKNQLIFKGPKDTVLMSKLTVIGKQLITHPVTAINIKIFIN